jgi:hypothetical protein
MSSDVEAPGIDLSGNITRFFREVVDSAIQARGLDATDAAETYVVALLVDYAKPDQLSGETLCRPLTLLFDEALQAAGHERFERLRSLGDGVLYVSGFFGDHLQMRGVELGYVSALGARAYDSAAAMLRRGAGNAEAGAAPDVFAELAHNFDMFVELMNEVADALFAQSVRTDSATLRLYERWLRNGSSSLSEALSARGLVPLRGDRTLH